MECAICHTRRPRRFCPGVRGDICSICCGSEREVTVSCPLDCEYLREARRHEKPLPLDPEQIPNRDIKVSEEFLDGHVALVETLANAMADAASRIPGAVDTDARDAVKGLIRTYRTLESGVYYASRPESILAAGIFDAAQEAVSGFQREERQDTGLTRTRDSDVLKALVFLERIGIDRNNGRPRGRAFIDALRQFYAGGDSPEPAASDSLILP
ncbi:MAG: hypothetical protein ABSF25_05810 [Bryobacteraceae bacterium]|jgi:hypothetical protein